MSKRIYSKSIESEIVVDYAVNQLSATEIAKKYGYKTIKTIYDILDKHSIERRKANSKFKDIDEEVLKLAKEGIKTINICELFGISKSQFYAIKKRNNFSKKGRIYLTEEEEEELIKDYLNGLPTQTITEKFGYKTNNSIYQALEKYNIPRRTSRETKMLGKEYDNFSMENIDNQFKAYFLGLILSDGWVHGTQVYLSMTDKDVIEFCSKIIGKSFTEVKKSGNRKVQYRICLSNEKLVQELKRFNIVEKKSLILKGFELKKEEKRFFPYIIRGIIDGDGWIKKDGNEFFISTGSEEFAYWLKEEMEEKLFMEDLNIAKGEGIFCVRSGYYKNISILKSIIFDKPFGMGRKYNKLHGKSSTTTMEQLA